MLPVPVEDSTFYDADRVGFDKQNALPVANAAVFSLLRHSGVKEDLLGDFELPFTELCRKEGQNKDSCESDVGKLLFQLIRLIRPTTVIEVGVYRGAASCHLALALERNGDGGVLHLVDISTNALETAATNLGRYGLRSSRIFFHLGDSADIARSGSLPVADMIFLDGNHARDAIRRDLRSYWQLTRECGLLVVHDSILWNGVRQQINELAQVLPERVYTLATTGGSGISIICRPKGPFPIGAAGP